MKIPLGISLLFVSMSVNADFYFSASDVLGVAACSETSLSRDKIEQSFNTVSRDPCKRSDDGAGTTQFICNPDGRATFVYVTKTSSTCESLRKSIKSTLN